MLTRALLALIAIGAVTGCGRTPDEAPPVGALSVAVDRPAVAIGTPLDFTYRFTVAPDAPAFTEDYTVFVHFIGRNGEQLWTDDHDPPTPTRQWAPGETVEYTRTMFVPKVPYAGGIEVIAGLYSPLTGGREPLVGDSAGMRSYRVATFDVREDGDGIDIVYRNGWHDLEVAGVEEWQWTRQEGRLSFRNPNEDVTVTLQLDQPANVFPAGQRVEVRLLSPVSAGPPEAQVLDAFTLPFGRRELRRIPLTAEQLGPSDSVDLAILVDRTFVPADVPDARSADPRELGVRVFRVYVEPKRR